MHNNRDIFYDEMVLIFFMNTIVKPRVKRLTDRHPLADYLKGHWSLSFIDLLHLKQNLYF